MITDSKGMASSLLCAVIWGRSLRLLYGGGRFALNGGAIGDCFMGEAQNAELTITLSAPLLAVTSPYQPLIHLRPDHRIRPAAAVESRPRGE